VGVYAGNVGICVDYYLYDGACFRFRIFLMGFGLLIFTGWVGLGAGVGDQGDSECGECGGTFDG
jgi:hypothetical protein